MLLGSCNKPGCTDPDAVNYDSSANDEDGTCQYVPSLSTTPLIYDTIAFSVQTGGIISSEGNSQITIKGICWSNSPNPTVNNDTTVNGFGLGSFVSNISNLNYNTTYFFRAYATNSNGTGYGNELSLNIGSFTNIPDANFEQALIDLGYDNLIDGKVITSKIDHIDSLNVVAKNIIDFSGIEGFTNLKHLYCGNNQLTSLDLSQNSQLIVLFCGKNELSTLNLTQNTYLKWVSCSENLLSNIILNSCNYLEWLSIWNNQLTTLDISQNSNLFYLNCDRNQLTTLDISSNTALTDLDCGSNQLSSLDVSSNTALTDLNCFRNQLTSLDINSNTAFTSLYCGENQLSSLDVSSNTALTSLDCGFNQLTSLDVSSNTALTYLGCYENQLTTLDISSNTALTSLGCNYNQLTNLDVSNNTALTGLVCNNNQLTSLDLSQNPSLQSLLVYNNSLTCLNIKNGYNSLISDILFSAHSNPNLSCIEVNNPTWSTQNWFNIDPGTIFSFTCNYPAGCF
jgi:Leucine-rich repeat (LRR) protein